MYVFLEVLFHHQKNKADIHSYGKMALNICLNARYEH